MATNQVKHSTPTTLTSGIANASANNAAGLLSNEIDNATNKDKTLLAELQITPAATLAAGSVVSAYILYAFDGTNYADGGTSVQPAKPPDGVFTLRTANSAQRPDPIAMPLLMPLKAKVLLWNGSGQNASGITLSLKACNDDIQAPA